MVERMTHRRELETLSSDVEEDLLKFVDSLSEIYSNLSGDERATARIMFCTYDGGSGLVKIYCDSLETEEQARAREAEEERWKQERASTERANYERLKLKFEGQRE